MIGGGTMRLIAGALLAWLGLVCAVAPAGADTAAIGSCGRRKTLEAAVAHSPSKDPGTCQGGSFFGKTGRESG